MVGQSIILPLILHSALSLIASLIFFPSTLSSLFTTRLVEVIAPLTSSLALHEVLLVSPLTSSDFSKTLAKIRAYTKQCEANLVPLAAAARLLRSDLIYSRFSPADFEVFQSFCRRLAARADGMAVYFSLVDRNREKFLAATMYKRVAETPIPTISQNLKVGLSKADSRNPSPDRSPASLTDRNYHNQSVLPQSSSPESVRNTSSRRFPTTPTPFRSAHFGTPVHPHYLPLHPHPHENHHHLHSDLPYHSLHSVNKNRLKKRESVVGVFETQRYLNLEFTKFHDIDEQEHTEIFMDLLSHW